MISERDSDSAKKKFKNLERSHAVLFADGAIFEPYSNQTSPR